MTKPEHITYQVLFVCVENSCRSQMAEAIFNHLAEIERLNIRAVSAGTRPSDRINPSAIKVLRETGIDVGYQKPKPLTQEVIAQSDKIVTMGCLAKDICPAAFLPKTEDWRVEDPAGKSIEKFRDVRDIIRDRVERLFSEVTPSIRDE
ncbi:MAG: low molecular weight phosphatase family protein, partial [Nitrososphaerales archaeon]